MREIWNCFGFKVNSDFQRKTNQNQKLALSSWPRTLMAGMELKLLCDVIVVLDIAAFLRQWVVRGRMAYKIEESECFMPSKHSRDCVKHFTENSFQQKFVGIFL